jgi:hypothetical protein
MIAHQNSLLALALLSTLSLYSQQQPAQNNAFLRPGLIASDDGGAPGYQHGAAQSRFLAGKQSRAVSDPGWSRQISDTGAFAISLHNGLALAAPNASPQADQKPFYTKDPADHEKQVMEYFISAGIPRDQIGGVHTMTRLSASGRYGEPHAAAPRIDGYISVLERKVQGFSVPDSVAYAQFDNDGHVISEGVYWPPVPAHVLRDAKRISDQLAATGAERTAFLARIPTGLPSGQVAIRHSSATEQQDSFEIIATYDVIERRTAAQPANTSGANLPSPAVAIVRHFDADGAEQHLPQERRNLEKQHPPSPKVPPPTVSRP